MGGLSPLAVGYSLKLLIDYLQRSQNELGLPVTIPVVVIAALAFRYVVQLVGDVVYWGWNVTYLDYLFRYKLQNEISIRYARKLAGMDMAYFEDPETQNLLTKVRDTMQWRPPDYLRTFGYLFSHLVGYVSALVVLWSYGWWIPTLITVVTLPRLYLRTKYGAVQWSIYGAGAPQSRKLWYFAWLLQNPTAVREMRIFQSQETLIERFRKIQTYLYELNKEGLDRYLKVLVFPPAVEMIVLLGLGYLFLPQVLSSVMTIGAFTLLVSMMEQLNTRAASIASKLGEMYEIDLYVDDLFRVFELPQQVKEIEKPKLLGEIKPPKIEFRNVSFGYEGGEQVLKKISFVIEPGENVALVGHNGAGKSTIIKLLCRFYDVSEGEILINGVNIKELKLADWYQFLGTLFQEFVQYHFTVRENITLGDTKVHDEEKMKLAAQRSGAAEFIERLPKKYDQMLGKEFEEGTELSTGQWQKLAIARAFYEEAPVLILDEPTSAIDAEAEYEIFNNLEKEYRNKTLLLVSHRFSTVRNADKIMVLDHGEIIEQGSHADLVKRKGVYARMFKTQAKGYA